MPMDERTVTFDDAYFINVLNMIEWLLWDIPRPAFIEEKPGRKSTTEYRFQEPVRKDDVDKKRGRITLNYSQTTTTEYASIAGPVLEKDPIVFECFEEEGKDQVVVKGYCTARKESESWIMPIFNSIWQKVLETFSD